MCFITLMYKVVPGHAVVLAANRDEFLDRPSLPPHRLGEGVWGGQDARAGGTWLGVGAGGRVVAITNILSRPAPVPGARSRGLLCLDLLKLPPHRDCQGVLESYVLEHRYSEFNLLLAEEGAAWVATYNGGELGIAELSSGIHFVGNGLPEEHSDPKVQRAGKLIHPPLDIHEALGTLMAACRDHGSGNDRDAGTTTGPDALCVHGERHGTVSSTIIALRDGLFARSLYFFADGNPCQREYHDLSGMLGK
ncbi:MAG: NRDE family protein [Phycisphaerae bacterium]|jgi:uncharacterized protein with NRDE domain